MHALLQRLFSSPSAPAAPAAPAASAPRPVHSWADPDLIWAEQVTPEKLLSLFRQAYMEVESLPDSSLSLKVTGDCRLHVSVDAPRKLLCFSAFYELRAEADWQEKLALANRINDRVVLVRVSVTDSTTLTSDHFIRLEGVFTPRQLVEGARQFAETTRSAIQRLDVNNVVA